MRDLRWSTVWIVVLVVAASIPIVAIGWPLVVFVVLLGVAIGLVAKLVLRLRNR